MHLRTPFPRPTINWVRACLAPALALIALGVDRGYQTDFWHHLARGRLLAEGGGRADVDTFTFTVAGQVIQDANWLSQLFYYRLFAWGGVELVQFANAIVIGATFGFLTLICLSFPPSVRRGRSREGERSVGVAAAVSVGAFIALRQTFLIRPQSFSLLLFVVSYLLLTLGRERSRWLWLMPPTMALWANVHGGFPIGLILIVSFIAAEIVTAWRRSMNPSSPSLGTPGEGRGGGVRPTLGPHHPLPRSTEGGDEGRMPHGLCSINRSTWRYAACLLASIAATTVNPYGWKLYAYVLTLSSRAAGRGIEEWLPPSFSNWTGTAFFGSVLVVATLAALTRRHKLDRRPLIVAACFLPLACGSVRMSAWWVLAAAPAAAGMIASMRRRNAQKAPAQPSWAAGVAMACLAGACVVASPWVAARNPLFSLRSSERTEVILQAIANQLPPGRLFTRLEWGEYFDWSSSRRSPVFMDGRIEIYPDPVWADYLVVSAGGEEWAEILKKWAVDALVLDEAYHSALLSHVNASPDWKRVATAGRAVALVRKTPSNGAAAAAVFP